MAAPTDDDLKYYPGTDGNPGADTGAIIGAIDTGAELNDTSTGNLVGPLTITNADVDYYGGAYRKNEATGDLTEAVVTNRAGANPNTSAGTAQISSTSSADTGTIRITGKVSSVWVQEDLTLNGTSSVFSVHTWDSGSVVRWEHLSSGAAAIPSGHVTCSIASEICGIIWADEGDTPGTITASAEIQVALKSSKSSTLTAADRLTAPTSISAFSSATSWAGDDQSIPVPGGSLDAGEYIGFVLLVTVYANVPPSADAGKFYSQLALVGVPVA